MRNKRLLYIQNEMWAEKMCIAVIKILSQNVKKIESLECKIGFIFKGENMIIYSVDFGV